MFVFSKQGSINKSDGSVDKALKIGIGGMLYGNGDITGYLIYNEYFKKISSYFAYSLRLSYGFGNNESLTTIKTNTFDQFSTSIFDLEINLAPFKLKKHSIYLGFGGSVRYFYSTYVLGYRYFDDLFSIDAPDEWINMAQVDYEQSQGIDFGYILSLNYSIKTSNRMTLGLRASFQSFRGDTIAFIGINYGFNL